MTDTTKEFTSYSHDEEYAEKIRNVKFNLSKVQAYVSLVTSLIAAIVILYFAYLIVSRDNSDFSLIISLTIFYAVSQSGIGGFISISEGIASVFIRK